MKRRSQLEIIHDMLAAALEKRGKIKRTHLMYKSNLSSQMMKEYLELLDGRGLLAEEPTTRELLLTDKGRAFLFEFKRMSEFTDSFGL